MTIAEVQKLHIMRRLPASQQDFFFKSQKYWGILGCMIEDCAMITRRKICVHNDGDSWTQCRERNITKYRLNFRTKKAIQHYEYLLRFWRAVHIFYIIIQTISESSTVQKTRWSVIVTVM